MFVSMIVYLRVVSARLSFFCFILSFNCSASRLAAAVLSAISVVMELILYASACLDEEKEKKKVGNER